MKHVIITIILSVTFLVAVGMFLFAEQIKYETFNRDFLTAQYLEYQLQNQYNDSNITIEIYEPGAIL